MDRIQEASHEPVRGLRLVGVERDWIALQGLAGSDVYARRSAYREAMGNAKRTYSQRHGRGPASVGLSLYDLTRSVRSVWAYLWEQGLFEESFGHEPTPDEQQEAASVGVFLPDDCGFVGADPDAFFLRKTGRTGIWPILNADPFGPQWDQDTLLDVVEVMHDLASTPNRDGWGQRFDREAGRKTYRDEMNGILSRMDPPHVINDDGYVEQLATSGFEGLLTAELPPGTDEELVGSRVRRAVAVFRTRGVSEDDLREAVRELYGVLEVLRPSIKAEMLSKDEGALFGIANGFAIRHAEGQKRDYDKLTWLRWTFYVYLATVHAMTRVVHRQAAEQAKAGG